VEADGLHMQSPAAADNDIIVSYLATMHHVVRWFDKAFDIHIFESLYLNNCLTNFDGDFTKILTTELSV